MKRFLFKIAIVSAILITATAVLSGCQPYKLPKVPVYGAVQSSFCLGMTDMDRCGTSNFGIDFAFKNEQFDKGSLKADLYLGAIPNSCDAYEDSYLSIMVMAIECNSDGPYKTGEGDMRPYVRLEGKFNEFTEEQYREFLADDTIELKTKKDGKYEYERFNKQVLLQIPFEEFCADYNIEKVESQGNLYLDEIKYNKRTEITISDTLLKEDDERSILFVAFGVRKKFADTETSDLPVFGYVRVKYRLSNNTVKLG